MTTPTIQSLAWEICSDCNMDKSVHARYGKCPVYVISPIEGAGIFPDDRTQAQRHDEDHRRIHVPGCGYCRDRAIRTNASSTDVLQTKADSSEKMGA